MVYSGECVSIPHFQCNGLKVPFRWNQNTPIYNEAYALSTISTIAVFVLESREKKPKNVYIRRLG